MVNCKIIQFIDVKARTSVSFLTIISFKALDENLIRRRLAGFLRQLWHTRILDFDVVEEGESVIGRFIIIDGTLMAGRKGSEKRKQGRRKEREEREGVKEGKGRKGREESRKGREKRKEREGGMEGRGAGNEKGRKEERGEKEKG